MAQVLSPGEPKQPVAGSFNWVPAGDVVLNTTQHVIVLTRDRAELCIRKHMHRMEKRFGWVSPLGILIPILAALLTSTFQGAYGLDGATWHSLFIVGAIGSAGWLLYALLQLIFNRSSVDSLLEELSTGSHLTDVLIQVAGNQPAATGPAVRTQDS